jgi:nitrogen fixation protein FixH
MRIAANETCCARPLTGRFVLFCMVAFFAVIALVNAVMIRFAVTTFGGVETSSSYQAGLAYAREAAAVQAQDALHWQVKASVQRRGGKAWVEIDARDAEGRPLAGLQAVARLAHPADRRTDQAVELSENTSGRFGGSAEAIAGQWDVIIELSRDGQRLFRSRNRVILQ